MKKSQLYPLGFFLVFWFISLSVAHNASTMPKVEHVFIAFEHQGKPNLDAVIRVQVDKLGQENINNLMLYINDVPFKTICAPHLANGNILVFKLDRDAILAQTYYLSESSRAVTIEVGNSQKILYRANAPNFRLIYYEDISLGLGLVLILLFLILFMIAARKTSLIRKNSVLQYKPYSLSKTLLGFWTLIISSSLLFLTLIERRIPTVSWQILLLLGINMATELGGSLANHIQDKDREIKEQAANFPSKGFWYDILSGHDGTATIYRFQTVVFHIIFGFIFMFNVLQKLYMPTFTTFQFALLSISNGAYVKSKWRKVYQKQLSNSIEPIPNLNKAKST